MSDTKHNDGGPAFPALEDTVLYNGEIIHREKGMSLRDYFAAKASEEDIQYWQNDGNGNKIRSRSQARYLHADSMLKIREQ